VSRVDEVAPESHQVGNVVEKEGLFDRQTLVAAFHVAGTIVFDAQREDQILGASGSPHWVGLDEAQTCNRAGQAGSLEKATRDRVTVELAESLLAERDYRVNPRSSQCWDQACEYGNHK
jgi:hypothetical protein